MRWKKSGSNVWMAVVGLSGALWSLSLIQAQDAENHLDGVHSAVMNQDESRVYFIAGRFRGQSGLSVFCRLESGELEFESQIALDPEQFGGGNHLAVTSDESRIIVSGTTGDSIAVIRQELAEQVLEVEAYIHDDAQAGVLLNGPSGLAFDTTQKYLYVAAEDGSALTMFDLRQ